MKNLRNNFSFHIGVVWTQDELIIIASKNQFKDIKGIAPNESLEYLTNNFLDKTVFMIISELSLFDTSLLDKSSDVYICSYASYSKGANCTPLRFDLNKYLDQPEILKNVWS